MISTLISMVMIHSRTIQKLSSHHVFWFSSPPLFYSCMNSPLSFCEYSVCHIFFSLFHHGIFDHPSNTARSDVNQISEFLANSKMLQTLELRSTFERSLSGRKDRGRHRCNRKRNLFLSLMSSFRSLSWLFLLSNNFVYEYVFPSFISSCRTLVFLTGRHTALRFSIQRKVTLLPR